tara:strand:- start:892 stop:1173 length:282 start_codon:yes stop_codon:yes gene_type:complete
MDKHMPKPVSDEAEYQVGDLVHYYDTWVIPPDAVNWKMVDIEHDSMANIGIVIEVKFKYWEDFPLYDVFWLKEGRTKLVAPVNLRKAYIYEKE